MPKFAVFLHGRPVVMLDSKGERTPGGVYTWRSVEAADPEQAVAQARGKLLRDETLREEMWNGSDEPIEIEAEEVNALPEDADIDQADSGCVFYLDDEDAGV